APAASCSKRFPRDKDRQGRRWRFSRPLTRPSGTLSPLAGQGETCNTRHQAAELKKFTTVDAKYAPQVLGLNTSDDDMKQECVQWHSFALIDARCASAPSENHSFVKS